MSVYEVFDKIVDSNNTTVGGGAASALAGAMAAGMAGMVAGLSKGRELGLEDGHYDRLKDELDGIASQQKQGACDDERAFLMIKAAFALPKATDEEKAKRRAAVEEAAVTAATVPLDNARRSLRILEIAAELDGKYNTAAASDMECAVMLARMSVRGCALNIDANLGLIKTPETNASLADASAELKKTLQEKYSG